MVASNGPSMAEVRTVLPAHSCRCPWRHRTCHSEMRMHQTTPGDAGLGDDEASFFTNIHHIQFHRWTKALQRSGLCEQCEEGCRD